MGGEGAWKMRNLTQSLIVWLCISQITGESVGDICTTFKNLPDRLKQEICGKDSAQREFYESPVGCDARVSPMIWYVHPFMG